MNIPQVKHLNYNTGTSGNPVCRTQNNFKILGYDASVCVVCKRAFADKLLFLRLLLLLLSRT